MTFQLVDRTFSNQALARMRQAVIAVPYRFWLSLILLVAFALRTVGLGASDLVVDEGVSFFIASKDVRSILAYSLSSIWEHPPGYYVLLHGWMPLTGHGEFAMRYLSVIGGVLAVALVAALARRWFGRGMALWVSLLMAASPMALDYARNARMYSWLMALSLAAAYLFDRALHERRRRYLVFFVLTLLAALATHYLVGLVLLAYAIFLLVRWRRLPVGRSGLAATLALLFGAALLAILGAPGPRRSLAEMLSSRLSAPNELKALLPIYTHWPLGISGETIRQLFALPMAAFWWIVGAAGIVAMPRPRQWSRANLQWLLGLLIVVPPLAQWIIFPGKVLFPGISARHTSATVGMFILAVALGAAALARKRLALGRAVGSALLAIGLVICARQAANTDRPFSAPWDYAGQRMAAGEAYVFTYPFDWPQNTYYNRYGFEATPIPPGYDPISDADAAAMVAPLLAKHSSLWLSLYVGPTSTGQVEQALNRLAYPAERRWFPGIRGIIHYFAPLPLTEQPGGMNWDEGIRLNHWWMSDPNVETGDALRLEFQWQRTRPLPTHGFATLKLVGADGQVWARRQGGPCNDRCPTTTWDQQPVLDRLAFEIPADVPPGDYQLRLGWISEDGGPWLGRETPGAVEQVDLLLKEVHVRQAAEQERSAPALGPQLDEALAPGLELRSAALPAGPVRSGARLNLPLQFRVAGSPGPLDIHLLLAASGREERITQPAGPAWYPSEAWAEGTIVRVLPRFALPGTLKPGRYRVSVALSQAGHSELLGRAELGNLLLEDRLRQYVVPAVGDPSDAAWAEGVRLVRVQLPPNAQAGTGFAIRLIWQASGPTSRNWKVYVHLLGQNGQVQAQGDGYPQGGEAPGPGWSKGEVIDDTHDILLPADLAPGAYTLRIGFYDEETGERLPLAGGDDSLTLPELITVTKSGTS